MMAHAFNPGTLEAEAGGPLEFRFRASQDCIVRPCFKQATTTKNRWENKVKCKQKQRGDSLC